MEYTNKICPVFREENYFAHVHVINIFTAIRSHSGGQTVTFIHTHTCVHNTQTRMQAHRHTGIHTDTHTGHRHTDTHTHTLTHPCTCAHTHTPTHRHIHIHTHAHAHTHTYTCTHTHSMSDFTLALALLWCTVVVLLFYLQFACCTLCDHRLSALSQFGLEHIGQKVVRIAISVWLGTDRTESGQDCYLSLAWNR